jgi:hypothetical protein
MSFFNNMLGTQGLSGRQKLMGGLMAMQPMTQPGRPGGFAGGLGGLLQGIGNARGWAQGQIPDAPKMQGFNPSQLPGPVAMPQVGQMPPPQMHPSILPPAPNVAAGMVDPRRGRMQGLGFSGGYGGYGGGGY